MDSDFSDNHSDADVIKIQSEVSFTEKGRPSKSGQHKVPSTQKRINFVNSLADQHGVEVSEEVLRDMISASEFIDE